MTNEGNGAADRDEDDKIALEQAAEQPAHIGEEPTEAPAEAETPSDEPEAEQADGDEPDSE